MVVCKGKLYIGGGVRAGSFLFGAEYFSFLLLLFIIIYYYHYWFFSFLLLHSLACVGECFFFASMPTLKLLASMSEERTEFFFFLSFFSFCKPKTEGPIN